MHVHYIYYLLPFIANHEFYYIYFVGSLLNSQKIQVEIQLRSASMKSQKT